MGLPQSISIEMVGQNCATTHPEAVFGSILITTSNGKMLRYGPISCDQAIAANNLFYNSYTSMEPWRSGDAIGLMTIDNPTPFIPADHDLNRSGRRFDVILHPALLDLPIGQSIALSDMKPSARRSLLADAEGDKSVAAWLAALDDREIVTWRWHDKPIQLHSAAGRITVEPASHDQGDAVLAFRAFSIEDAVKEEEASKDGRHPDVGIDIPEFANAASVLTKRVAEYRRLESFMRVSAIFRWARSGGAEFVGRVPVLATERPATPDNLVVGWNGNWIAVAPQMSFERRTKDFCTTLPKLTGELAKTDTDLRNSLLEEFVDYCRK
jgi:hypothetical protein